MNMKHTFFLAVFCISSLFSDQTHLCSFPKINLCELVKYISKSKEVNIVADESLLDFDVSFMSNQERSSEQLFTDMLVLLEEYKLEAIKKDDCYIIRKKEIIKAPRQSENSFESVKLKYHLGDEILASIKAISASLNTEIEEEGLLQKAIISTNWVKSSNTLFFTANKLITKKLKDLIAKLDAPLKQVYVEVLVIETDFSKGQDFGVTWQNAPSAEILTACKDSLTNGLSPSTIGDAIINGKKIFSHISSFASFVQNDHNTSIVLNQKIIVTENHQSSIFEGDSIPFAGSVIKLTGANERTTSNIDYQDVGVSLQITPMISDTGMVTLSMDEKITESRDHLIDSATNLSGIKTSKTQMKTQASIPDNHFLILSGMSRKVKSKRVSKVPLLGYIPIIGSLFTKEREVEQKKSLIIFVRPHIVEEQTAQSMA